MPPKCMTKFFLFRNSKLMSVLFLQVCVRSAAVVGKRAGTYMACAGCCDTQASPECNTKICGIKSSKYSFNTVCKPVQSAPSRKRKLCALRLTIYACLMQPTVLAHILLSISAFLTVQVYKPSLNSSTLYWRVFKMADKVNSRRYCSFHISLSKVFWR